MFKTQEDWKKGNDRTPIKKLHETLGNERYLCDVHRFYLVSVIVQCSFLFVSLHIRPPLLQYPNARTRQSRKNI